MKKELKRARKEWLRRAMQEAARDPMFLRDIEETQIAFATVDAETARMIPDEQRKVSDIDADEPLHFTGDFNL